MLADRCLRLILNESATLSRPYAHLCVEVKSKVYMRKRTQSIFPLHAANGPLRYALRRASSAAAAASLKRQGATISPCRAVVVYTPSVVRCAQRSRVGFVVATNGAGISLRAPHPSHKVRSSRRRHCASSIASVRHTVYATLHSSSSSRAGFRARLVRATRKCWTVSHARGS